MMPVLRKVRLGLPALLLSLVACATTVPVADPPAASPPPSPAPLAETAPAPALPPRPGVFANLPGWASADLSPALQAMGRTCAIWRNRDPFSTVSGRATYAGTIADWLPACAGLEVAATSDEARVIFEALFTPVAIDAGPSTPRFTGYFEPEISVRRAPVWPYIVPVPARPADLVHVDAARLGKASGGRVPAQRLGDGSLRPYPSRANITTPPSETIAYAHPADLFFLQIQGSGRLQFEDGEMLRAAFSAHNGQPFRSTANWLIDTGRITRGEASMQGIRAWMERVGIEEARRAMNQNPRFVFFEAKPIGDETLGPVGAQAVPLTPLGSVAVDPRIHALGVPMFIETTAPGLGGLWQGLLIAQDTGGAIRGAVRGDIYYGTGMAAGARAGTTNAPGRMWMLLPDALATRLSGDDVSS